MHGSSIQILRLKGHCHLPKSSQMYAICGAKYEVIAAEHDYDIRFSQKVLNFIKNEF